VHVGEAVFGADVASLALRAVAAPKPSPGPFAALTARERDVLELVARGASNTEIAHDLVLSQKTVRNHLSNILTKLQVNDRAKAIVVARENGFGTNGS
jgi:DNA-binding NarL/FixJ family response regulator